SGDITMDFRPTKAAKRYGLVFRKDDQLVSIDPVTKRRKTVVSFIPRDRNLTHSAEPTNQPFREDDDRAFHEKRNEEK
ncbi:hypothetical protein LCGC14_2572270, partial [marine sediment metagenome]